jgi:hypothetical protein
VGIVLLVTLAWIMIVIISHGGIQSYIEMTNKQFRWRFDKPGVSVLGAEVSPGYLWDRTYEFTRRFFVETVCFGFGRIYQGIMTLGFIIGGILYLVSERKRLNFLMLNLIWMIPYFLMIFLFLPPTPRRFVPLLPIMALFIVKGWHMVPWNGIILGILIACTLYFSWHLADEIHEKAGAPERAIRYITRNFQQDETTIFTRSIGRHMTYYLGKEWKKRGLFTEEDILKEMKNGQTVITDFDPASFITDIEDKGLTFEELYTFTRDPKVHGKHSTVRLYKIYSKE